MHSCPDKGRKKSFVLPFVTLTEDRLKDFTKNMEMAAILYLAESGREKGESHLLKKPDEKLVFITEAFYPIWLVPNNGATLMFDGLGLTSHALSYDAIPDVEIFNKNIRETRAKTEAYAATLFENADYFTNFYSEEESKIDGLITAPELMRDFETYLHQMKEAEESLTANAVLTSTLQNHEIQASIEQLSNIRKKTVRDIEKLDESMKFLNITSAGRIRAIREEIKKIGKKYEMQIRNTKPRVTRKIWQIQHKHNIAVARESGRLKERLGRLRKNQVKLQKTLTRLRLEAKRCANRIHSSRHGSKIRWTLEHERIKKKLPILRKEIEENTKRMVKFEAAQKLEFARLKTECDKRVETAKKVFQDLRASREAEIAIKRQEIVALESITCHITKSMQEMVLTKKVSMKEFDAITLRGAGKQVCKLVHIPFYLARYETGDKKRYVVYPPSTVGDMGLMTKMKGAMGAAKMKALLQSRSKAMTTFLNQLAVLIGKNPMLEKELTEVGIRDSILLKKQLRRSVKKGLKELENENWMSENELQTFSRLLYIYA